MVSYFGLNSLQFLTKFDNFSAKVSSTLFFVEYSTKHQVRQKVTFDGNTHLTRWFLSKFKGSKHYIRNIKLTVIQHQEIESL